MKQSLILTDIDFSADRKFINAVALLNGEEVFHFKINIEMENCPILDSVFSDEPMPSSLPFYEFIAALLLSGIVNAGEYISINNTVASWVALPEYSDAVARLSIDLGNGLFYANTEACAALLAERFYDSDISGQSATPAINTVPVPNELRQLLVTEAQKRQITIEQLVHDALNTYLTH